MAYLLALNSRRRLGQVGRQVSHKKFMDCWSAMSLFNINWPAKTSHFSSPYILILPLLMQPTVSKHWK